MTTIRILKDDFEIHMMSHRMLAGAFFGTTAFLWYTFWKSSQKEKSEKFVTIDEEVTCFHMRINIFSFNWNPHPCEEMTNRLYNCHRISCYKNDDKYHMEKIKYKPCCPLHTPNTIKKLDITILTTWFFVAGFAAIGGIMGCLVSE